MFKKIIDFFLNRSKTSTTMQTTSAPASTPPTAIKEDYIRFEGMNLPRISALVDLSPDAAFYSTYKKCFDILPGICAKLNIDLPYIYIKSVLMTPEQDRLYAYTNHLDDDETQHLIMLCADVGKDQAFLIGILAHECRHIWQRSHLAPQSFTTNAYGYNALYDTKEIDADAFAICYLADGDPSLFMQCSKIVCYDEWRIAPDAINCRIDRTYNIANSFALNQG